MKLRFAQIMIGLALLAGFTTFASSAHAAVGACSWNGSVNGNWSVPGNWDAGCTGVGGIPGTGDTLTFPLSAANATMTNDLPAITLQSLNFTGAQNYTLIGANAIALTSGIEVTGGSQTINAPLTVGGAGVNFHVASGTDLTLNGTLTLDANNLSVTVDTPAGVTGVKITGAISGSGGAKFSKYGSGALQFNGTHHLETFDIDVNAGSVSSNPAAATYLPYNGMITLAAGTRLDLSNFAQFGSIAGAGEIHASGNFGIRQNKTATFTGDIFGSKQMSVMGTSLSKLIIDRSGGSLSYAGTIDINSTGELILANTTATSVSKFLVSMGRLELINSHVGEIQVGYSSGASNYDGILALSGPNASTAATITVLNNSSVTSTINSTSDYGHLTVTAPVDLGTSTSIFGLQGSYVPMAGDVFTIITNTNLGTATKTNAAFFNLPQGGALPFNGFNMVADYQAAGNTAFTLTTTTPDIIPPTIQSIVRAQVNPTSFSTVVFTITFSETVTGVDTADFTPITTGISGAFVKTVTVNTANSYWVGVDTGTGDGTLRLDLPVGATISDAAGNPIAGMPYTGGETYTIYKNSAPTDISLSASTVLENQPVDTTIGTLTTTDPDAGDTHTYSFACTIPGVDDASFQVSGANLQTAIVFDYETKNAYHICIRTIDDNGGTFDKNFTIDVINIPGVELLSPSSNATLHTNLPTFDWADYVGSKGYQLQVSKSSGFGTTVLNVSTASTASIYVPTKNLIANTLYYWRVRSKITSTTYTPWSAVWSFTTGNPPATPSLSSPANGALVSGPSVLFDWKDVTISSGAIFDHYQIQISTDNTFSNIIRNQSILGLTNSQDNGAILNPASTYYWRVRSFNTAGDYSAWSAVWSVKIKYPAPTLLSPVNLSVAASLKPTFTWSAVIGATGYNIQIAKTTAFGFGTLNANVTGLTYTATTNLAAHTTYYWRVRATGPYGPSDWSLVWSFTTP